MQELEAVRFWGMMGLARGTLTLTSAVFVRNNGQPSPHASVLILDNPRKYVEAIWSRQTSEKTQGNTIKLYQWRFRLKFGRRFYTQRIVGHWNRLSREVVTGPSLSECPEFKKYALRNMV